MTAAKTALVRPFVCMATMLDRVSNVAAVRDVNFRASTIGKSFALKSKSDALGVLRLGAIVAAAVQDSHLYSRAGRKAERGSDDEVTDLVLCIREQRR